VVPGAAGAFRRAALLEVGGYPADTLVEDADLTVNLLAAGWRIPYEAAAVAWTEAPERVSAALGQRRRWAYGTFQVMAKHAGAMLDPTAGRVGLLGLPWMALSQVLLPIAGPLADLYLLYLVATGNRPLAALILGLAVVLDLAVAGAAVLAEREDPRLLLAAPLSRLVWRPLQLFAVIGSVRRWTHGDGQRWSKVERYNTVDVPAPAETATVLVGSTQP
jgi:peptidoglycan-N-acetylglucosamine deacetylase